MIFCWPFWHAARLSLLHQVCYFLNIGLFIAILWKFVTISSSTLGSRTFYHYYIAFMSFHSPFLHFVYFIVYIVYLFCTLDGTGPLQWAGGPSSKPGKPKGKKKCSSRQKFDVRLYFHIYKGFISHLSIFSLGFVKTEIFVQQNS